MGRAATRRTATTGDADRDANRDAGHNAEHDAERKAAVRKGRLPEFPRELPPTWDRRTEARLWLQVNRNKQRRHVLSIMLEDVDGNDDGDLDGAQVRAEWEDSQ
jgi:hypothetical protein